MSTIENYGGITIIMAVDPNKMWSNMTKSISDRLQLYIWTCEPVYKSIAVLFPQFS